jgi:hypothetical protein
VISSSTIADATIFTSKSSTIYYLSVVMLQSMLATIESPIIKHRIALRRIHIHNTSGPRFVSSPSGFT